MTGLSRLQFIAGRQQQQYLRVAVGDFTLIKVVFFVVSWQLVEVSEKLETKDSARSRHQETVVRYQKVSVGDGEENGGMELPLLFSY